MTKKYPIMKVKSVFNLLTEKDHKFVNKSSKLMFKIVFEIFYKDYISKIFETK